MKTGKLVLSMVLTWITIIIISFVTKFITGSLIAAVLVGVFAALIFTDGILMIWHRILGAKSWKSLKEEIVEWYF